MRGIFVTSRGHIEGRQGGVQVCTKEYVDIIQAAGIDLSFCLLEADRRLSTRIARRFISSPYFRPAEPGAIKNIAKCFTHEVRFVFLNQVSLADLAGELKRILPFTSIVVLSHGLESTDLLHFIRLRQKLPLKGRARPTASFALGHALLSETKYRPEIDLVCGLSPSDVTLEQWVGSKRATWLPRIVQKRPLSWTPGRNRLGFVGTLDHAPNLEGLTEILTQLTGFTRNELRVRVVGGPASCGRWLAKRYPVVDYLGQLDDAELCREASSWNAFLHPIFCLARGCSTKLATAIGWEIPIITTTYGARGYQWTEGELLMADDAIHFAHLCRQVLQGSFASEIRKNVAQVARSSPTLDENAGRLRAFLGIEPKSALDQSDRPMLTKQSILSPDNFCQ